MESLPWHKCREILTDHLQASLWCLKHLVLDKPWEGLGQTVLKVSIAASPSYIVRVWRTHPYGALLFFPFSTHCTDLRAHHGQVQQAQRMEDVIKTSSAKGKGCRDHQVGVMVCMPRRNLCCFRLDLPYPGVRQNILISKTDESTTEFPENMVMRENLSKQQSSTETGAKTATAFWHTNQIMRHEFLFELSKINTVNPETLREKNAKRLIKPLLYYLHW